MLDKMQLINILGLCCASLRQPGQRNYILLMQKIKDFTYFFKISGTSSKLTFDTSVLLQQECRIMSNSEQGDGIRSQVIEDFLRNLPRFTVVLCAKLMNIPVIANTASQFFVLHWICGIIKIAMKVDFSGIFILSSFHTFSTTKFCSLNIELLSF